jgi:hypothetical protein
MATTHFHVMTDWGPTGNGPHLTIDEANSDQAEWMAYYEAEGQPDLAEQVRVDSCDDPGCLS